MFIYLAGGIAWAVTTVLCWRTSYLYYKLRSDSKGWDDRYSEKFWAGLAGSIIPALLAFLLIVGGFDSRDHNQKLGNEDVMSGIMLSIVSFFSLFLVYSLPYREYSEQWRRRNTPPPQTNYHAEDCNCCGIGGCAWQPPDRQS